MNKISFIGLSIIVASACFAQAIPDGSYFGQRPPGDSAVVFAPGIISLADADHNIGKVAFSPDGKECYITV